MFIFLDESGNFSGDRDDYFIVGGFVTGTPRRTAKEFRKWQHKKFPKKLRRKNEVKFSDTGLNDEMRLKTLAYFLNKIFVFFILFLKKRISRRHIEIKKV